MRLVSGAAEGLAEGQYARLAEYRHQVFVEYLRWEDLRAESGREADQFDRSDTVYVMAEDDHANIIGCARLLPTTKPYLLGEVFPQLLNGLPPPNSPDVWELSRFAAVDVHKKSARSGQFSSPVARKLLEESIGCAASRGAKRLITVSPIGVERLLSRSGINSHRAGPPMIIDGHPIFACWIELKN
ncbi:acyl-homoserine-lactone synthase [Acidithiobacillus sp.]|jgi:N-acyl-L-homoserine lactone synthetase|uniref:acyl-homoserine-lactone synthase n=1 Tax=Acidithiobacillus sp. TaxID=1872118 RepID=UPI0025C31D50|nr:acyl-homoserine-lactone synthase [Acidithiobacillus sp.]MCK9189631.1 GNAT family N-acetyltransferase [Acidithiobacillus sp.]MCK9360107.1 GNAT family N-acetyltransferase [Acidithiobacillus sp.]